jgi:hypothetical protein
VGQHHPHTGAPRCCHDDFPREINEDSSGKEFYPRAHPLDFPQELYTKPDKEKEHGTRRDKNQNTLLISFDMEKKS